MLEGLEAPEIVRMNANAVLDLDGENTAGSIDNEIYFRAAARAPEIKREVLW